MRVVIGDDEALLRQGLAALLSEAGFEVVGMAGDAPGTLALVDREQPDILVTDIRMPPHNRDDGLRAAVEVRTRHPRVAVMVLSQHVNRQYALDLLAEDNRYLGYLLKQRVADAAGFCADLRTIAKRRTPKAAFDYTDGAAEGELSLTRAREAFEDIEFHPRVLRDVSAVDTSTTIFGGPSALPFGIAPTGFTRLMQTQGERAGASSAGAHGIPFTLSTLGTTSIEGVKEANPDGRNWFQLYVMRDRDFVGRLIDRAKAAGCSALVLTLDLQILGQRHKDIKNGLTAPPKMTLSCGACLRC